MLNKLFDLWSSLMHELTRSVPYTIDQHGSEGLFVVGLVFGLFMGVVIGAMLRREIIEVLFQHGDFDASSVDLTAWALPFFALGLSAFAMVKVIVPAFYALQDARTPVKTAFMAMFLNIGFNFLFIRSLQTGGPALATSLAAFFNSLLLLGIFCKRYGSFGMRSIARSVMKFGVASLVVGIVSYVLIHWPGFYAGHMGRKALALGVTIGFATTAYFGSISLLGSRELAELRAARKGTRELWS